MLNGLSSRRPARASLAHTWKRILLWLFPGLTPIPLFILGEDLQGTLALPDWALGVGLFGCFALLVAACAWGDALLHLTRVLGAHNIAPGQVARFAALFVMVQFLLAPFLTLLIGAFLWSGLVLAP